MPHRPHLLLAAATTATLATRPVRRTEPVAPVPPAPNLATGIIDHHVHILGPDVMRDWKSLGVTFSRPDSIYRSATSLLAERGDSVAAVVLVPMGHLYSNPAFVGGLGIDSAEMHRRVRSENAWVAAEAAHHPGRASALCSVPALAPWALGDLTWCRDSLRSAGIKLHLASSQVDLRDATHLARLATIAGFASAHQLPILLHVDPQRRGHDSTHVRALAEQVFAPHPDLTVIIAHLGGSGGYGPWTRTVFRTLRGWQAEVEKRGPPRRIFFELSAVALERESEGVPPITAAEAAMLRDDLRRHGMRGILFGSDYPVFAPVAGAKALRTTVGLTADEVQQITQRTVIGTRVGPRDGRS